MTGSLVPATFLIDLRCPDCGYVHQNAGEEDMRIWRDEGCPNGHPAGEQPRERFDLWPETGRFETEPKR